MRKYYSCDNGFNEASEEEGVCWVDIIVPDEDDVRYLTEKEGVPSMFLEYLSDLDERPRVERDGDWIMTIIRFPVRSHTNSMPYLTIPMGIISKGPEKVYTVCYRNNKMLEDFAEHTRQRGICFDNVANFTIRIIYATAFWFLDSLKRISSRVVSVERTLQKSVKNDDLISLMNIQRSLVFFNTSIKADSMVLERVGKIYGDTIDKDLYEDIDIELRQADSTAVVYTDILEGTMDACASIVSNNVNGVMKRMTGISIMLMVPTFVASLYGMNVDILLTGHNAFWVIILIATVLTVGAYFLFRKLKWV